MTAPNDATDTGPRDTGGLNTVDTFVCEVPWSPNRTVLVHRRRHGWRDYVLLRTWNRHRKLGLWYPTTRGFVIPLDRAIGLANAMEMADAGAFLPEPEWLVDRD